MLLNEWLAVKSKKRESVCGHAKRANVIREASEEMRLKAGWGKEESLLGQGSDLSKNIPGESMARDTPGMAGQRQAEGNLGHWALIEMVVGDEEQGW